MQLLRIDFGESAKCRVRLWQKQSWRFTNVSPFPGYILDGPVTTNVVCAHESRSRSEIPHTTKAHISGDTNHHRRDISIDGFQRESQPEIPVDIHHGIRLGKSRLVPSIHDIRELHFLRP